MIVLSLCDRSGVMVQPWLEAGYTCWIVDVQHPTGAHSDGRLVRLGASVGMLPATLLPPRLITFAFPPCTHLANSGNRHKRDKGLEALYEALGLVIACKRICEASGAPWMLENPIGSLSTYWRPPDMTFHPWQYGTPKERKRTCIWAGNNFVLPPIEVPDEPADVRESCWRMPPSPDRGDRRSLTPGGFARAVFAANDPWIRERTSPMATPTPSDPKKPADPKSPTPPKPAPTPDPPTTPDRPDIDRDPDIGDRDPDIRAPGRQLHYAPASRSTWEG